MLDRFKNFWQGVMLAPFINLFLRLGISPDAVTLVGTLGVSVGALVFFPQGMLWQGVVMVTLFVFSDLIDGAMARKMGRKDDFGAFLDSTLDRLADGFLLGGLAVFYATSTTNGSIPLMITALLGLIGAFMTSYTRARAESLGIDAKVGILQRPERIVLLSAPQALFGLVFNGWVLAIITVILTVTAWITVIQRVAFVYRATTRADAAEARTESEVRPRFWSRSRTPRPLLKGD